MWGRWKTAFYRLGRPAARNFFRSRAWLPGTDRSRSSMANSPPLQASALTMPTLKSFPGTAAGPALATLTLLALAALVMWPALDAGFLRDDWDFLASSAHLPTPLPYFLENYSRGYFYRPNGMLVWWLMNRAVGPVPAWHYALQILVHAGCALAALGLMRRLGASLATALGASVVLVVHPAAVATSLWLSSRFDLLAALGLLPGLALLFGPRPGRPAVLMGLAACTWLAVGAKEIGLLMVPLAALALWLRTDLGRRDRVACAAAVMLAVLGWFVIRLVVFGSDDITNQRDPGLLGRPVRGRRGLVAALPAHGPGPGCPALAGLDRPGRTVRIGTGRPARRAGGSESAAGVARLGLAADAAPAAVADHPFHAGAARRPVHQRQPALLLRAPVWAPRCCCRFRWMPG